MPHTKYYTSCRKFRRCMQYGDVMAVCCMNHGEHINIWYGQNAGFLTLNLAFKGLKLIFSYFIHTFICP
jgi:hypothetical protein